MDKGGAECWKPRGEIFVHVIVALNWLYQTIVYDQLIVSPGPWLTHPTL
jgi:hypothetical protein